MTLSFLLDGVLSSRFAFPLHTVVQAQTLPLPQYGAAAVVGEPLEPCALETTIPDATILAPSDDWQSAVEEVAPGATLLLREGVYQATRKLKIGAGQESLAVTIKPYNCEAVTLLGSFTPLSHTILAGLRIEGAGLPLSDLNYVIRVNGKKQGPIRNVVLRNNTIVGGEMDAIRIHDDVSGVELVGNHIDGGKGGHVIMVTTEVTTVIPAPSPNNIEITNNLLTKQYFQSAGIASEDMLQVDEAQLVRFIHNTCTQGYKVEQCVDIKSVTASLVIQANYFDGTTLHQAGAGEDEIATLVQVTTETPVSPVIQTQEPTQEPTPTTTPTPPLLTPPSEQTPIFSPTLQPTASANGFLPLIFR